MKTTLRTYVTPAVEVMEMDTEQVISQSMPVRDEGISDLGDDFMPQSNKDVWTDLW